MRTEIDAMLARSGGVAPRSRLLTVVTRGQLDHEVRTGQLVTPFTRAMCRPWDVDLPPLRRRAALTSVGPPATLSHLSALAAWTRPAGEDDPIHVTVPGRRCLRPQDGLVVHRVNRFPDVVRLDGLIVSTLAEALVACWPLIRQTERRGPTIAAVRQRLVTSHELSDVLAQHARVPDRSALVELIGLLADGCESELEIWGHQHVFDIDGLRHGVRQRAIRAGGRRYRLDLAYEAERVAVEMDGSTHGTRERTASTTPAATPRWPRWVG